MANSDLNQIGAEHISVITDKEIEKGKKDFDDD